MTNEHGMHYLIGDSRQALPACERCRDFEIAMPVPAACDPYRNTNIQARTRYTPEPAA